MQGKATVQHQWLHPVFAAFPVGCFGGALISDVISSRGDASFWPYLTLWFIAFGVIGSLATVISGLTDYLTTSMPAAAKRTATILAILTLAMLACYVAAFILRYGSPTSPLGHLLTYLGLVTFIASGWLGGRLVSADLLGTIPQAVGTAGWRRPQTSGSWRAGAGRMPGWTVNQGQRG